MKEKQIRAVIDEINVLEARNRALNMTIAQLNSEDSEENKKLVRGHIEELNTNNEKILELKHSNKIAFYIWECIWDGTTHQPKNIAYGIGFDNKIDANNHMSNNFTHNEAIKIKYHVIQTYEYNGQLVGLY